MMSSRPWQEWGLTEHLKIGGRACKPDCPDNFLFSIICVE
jgi:hypothetical protein